MPVWKLTLEYDGTRYRGWQEQKNAHSVQEELRLAAESLFGEKVEIQAAGRTDAGVHALAQIVHLRGAGRSASRSLSPRRVIDELNRSLPADIVVLAVEPAPVGLHPRHSALSRTYQYRISPRKTAFAKKYVWWVKEHLDLAAMREAAGSLPGRHDFIQFRAADPARPDESTIVQVTRADITEEDGLIVFRIEASHFLWRMVRRVVGALVEVGKHTLTPADFASLLSSHPTRSWPISDWTAPAAGLFLQEVRYPQGSAQRGLGRLGSPARASKAGESALQTRAPRQ